MIFFADFQYTISSEDYFVECATNAALQFNIGDHRKCHLVEIENDTMCEWNEGSNEQFSSTLIKTSGYEVNVVNGTVTVTVDDQNEPECSKFSSTLILGLKQAVVSQLILQLHWLRIY